MRNHQTLTRHNDIRTWVIAHRGVPALVSEREPSGALRARLALSFARHDRAPVGMPHQDDGVAPCSWTVWLAELDRQQLALEIKDDKAVDFAFIARRDLIN